MTTQLASLLKSTRDRLSPDEISSRVPGSASLPPQ